VPQVFLLLGSNLGQRKRYLTQAKQAIETRIDEIQLCSSIYKTAAWGKTDQADFYNQVVMIKTRKYPQTVLKSILEIELDLGRERDELWGPRRIDIDILFYGNKIIKQDNLSVPHPAFQERNFAIIPMMEIAAAFMHPSMNISVEEIYNQSTDTCDVYLLNE